MTVKSRFRPTSRAVALEPRILFDGAGAVAGADAFVDDWVDAPQETESNHQSPASDAANIMLFGLDDAPTVVPTVTDPLPTGTVRTTAEDTIFNPFDGAGKLDFKGGNDSDVVSEFTVTATGGTFRNPGAGVLSEGDSVLKFTGKTLGEIKTTLQGLNFTPDKDQNSQTVGYDAKITLSVDGGKSIDIKLSVTAVNDAPVLGGGVDLVVKEGESGGFDLTHLAPTPEDLDPDIKTGQQVIDQQMVVITGLPKHGTLTYNGGVVVDGMVIPVTDLGKLVYTHNGTDISADQADKFKIEVHDGGGGVTPGEINITITPKNIAPTINGSFDIIEGQIKVVAPTIDLGDKFDTLANSTITISDIDAGGQGEFFIIRDGAELILGTGTFTLTAAELAQLRFRHNGIEPNASGVTAPSYTITVTDAGGGEDNPLTASKTITLDVLHNNDDPILENKHPDAGQAKPIEEGKTITIGKDMLLAQDVDTPSNQLVYTVETRPTQGEIQLFIGGTAGPDSDGDGVGDGWIVLGVGGRFTQAQVDAGHVRYYQTTDVSSDTLDNFTFTVRDSAFGYDVWTDPANPTSGREGGVRDSVTGEITTQEFHFNIQAHNDLHTNGYTGDPRPATPGYGGDNLKYDHKNDTDNTNNVDWLESTGGEYDITQGMLEHIITRVDDKGNENPDDDVRIVVPPTETVYTLTGQPSNGIVQLEVQGKWTNIPTNGQFTQDDINKGRVRFVSDGSEDHTAKFAYTVSDGTKAGTVDGRFDIDITPTNDRPVADGGTAEIKEGDGNTVRLDGKVIGMTDGDLSLDTSKRTGEGAKDDLWFQIKDKPLHGTLERWDSTAGKWVEVGDNEWLSSALLTASADGGTSGLRYVHDGSEPLAYEGGVPKVTFTYQVRDDLKAPTDPFEVKTDTPTDNAKESSNVSAKDGTATINIIPVNDGPEVPDLPGQSGTIDSTITGGGELTSKNEILVVEEGGIGALKDLLVAIDRDNTTVQRQYQITQAPTEGTLMLNGKALGVGSTFTQDDLDKGRVTYEHHGSDKAFEQFQGINYHDKFHFTVSDGVLSDKGDDGNHNTFIIQVTPANDIPVITGPENLDVTGDGGTYVKVPPVTVTDSDIYDGSATDDFLRVEVKWVDGAGDPVAGAKISYDAGAPIDPSDRFGVLGKDSNTLIIQGTHAEVQAILDSLKVAVGEDRNDVDSNNTDKLVITVDDRIYETVNSTTPISDKTNGGERNEDGSDISDQKNRVEHVITLLASNKNDIPTITGTPSYTVNEDSSVVLGGITLTDADSFDKPVTVTVELYTDANRTNPATLAEGKLTYTGSVSSTGSGGSSITLTGTLAEVQEALNQIQFTGGADYNGGGKDNGTLYLKTTFTDYGHANKPNGNTVTFDSTITVIPVNDKPVLTVPGNKVLGDGGDSITITEGFGVQDTKDINQGAEDFITVTVTATEDGGTGYGTLTAQGKGTANVIGSGSQLVISGTNADVTATLNTLNYKPDNPNVDKIVTITAVADDRNPAGTGKGNGAENSGVDGNNTDTKSFTITVSGTNDAPVIEAPPTIDVNEDSTDTLLSGISYTDVDDFGGNQEVTLSVTKGTLSLGEIPGLTFTVGKSGDAQFTIKGTKDVLNAALASLKYTPDADYHGSDTLTITVTDKSGGGGAGTDGSIGTGPDQSPTKTITINVKTVNDRPTASTDVTLDPVNEDSPSPGRPFAGMGFGYDDTRDDQTPRTGGDDETEFSYIAVVGNAATADQGTWQVSSDGVNWIDIPATGLGVDSALVFKSTDQVRFVPNADFNGDPGKLTVRLADNSVADIPTSGNSADLKNLNDTVNGDIDLQTGAWNDADRTIAITVSPLNDAPVTKDSKVPSIEVSEDDSNTQGKTVSDLFGGVFDDTADDVAGGSNPDTFAGVAITDVTSDKGEWQYSTDGGSSWTTLSADDIAGDKAFVLKASDQLRFVSTTLDYNGTPTDSLTVRLIDNSQGDVTTSVGDSGRVDLTSGKSGGTTPYSDANNAVTLGAVVNPVNDAPTLDAGGKTEGITVTATEKDGVTGTGSAFKDPVFLLTDVNVADVDLGDGHLDSNVFGAGQITVTLTGRVTGDVLLVGDLAGIKDTTAYDPATGKFTIDLLDTATVAQVKAILQAIQYAHNSDDPTDIKSGSPKTERQFTVELSDGNNQQVGGHAGSPDNPLSATISGTITIVPDNDPPVATLDTNELDRTQGPITGNVITGTSTNGDGDKSNSTPDSDPDTHIDDLKITEITMGGVKTPVSETGETTVTGKYGTLTINPDGSYSYELDTSNPAVYALEGGETLKENFTYTLSDGTSTDNADLTITINGKTIEPPTIGAEDGNGGAIGEATVHEKGLTSDDDHSETTTGSITVKADAGVKTVTIRGEEFSLEDLKGYTPESPSDPIDTGKGTLVITGVEVVSGNNSAPTELKVNYSYTLKEAQDQTGSTESTDVITLAVTDNSASSTTVTGELTIQIIDDSPTAADDTNSVTKGGTGTVVGNVYTNDAIGADGPGASGPVTGVIAGPGTPGSTGVGTEVTGTYGGKVIINADGNYTYELDPENPAVKALAGSDTLTETFTYTITDNDGDTSTATLTITIHGNTPPVAVGESQTVPEDTPATGNVLDNDTDRDGDDLKVKDFTVVGVTGTSSPGDTVTIPGKGTITIGEDGSYTFTPVPDWNGTVPTITYTVTDGKGGEDSATLDITVTPVPDAFDDTTTTKSGVPVTLDPLGNDKLSNPDKEITEVTPGSNGTVTIEPDGRVTYTPEPGFVGEDTFTYTVTSGGITETATVTVTVTNTPPALQPDTQVVPEDTPATGNVLKNDGTEKDGFYVDGDGDPLKVTGFEVQGKPYQPGETADIPGVGKITIGKDGNYTFVPVSDWNGKVPTVNYTVTDGNNNGTVTSTLDITVTPVPDAVPDVTKTESATPVTINPLDNDRFTNPDQKVTGVTQGKGGTVVIDPDGSVTYTPDTSFFGEDTFTYTVTSGGVTETTTVTVHVADVNPVTPPPPPFDGLPPSPTPSLQPMNPLMGDQAGEPSVFFEGATFDKVLRMPLPFHPVVYVNQEVENSQNLRAEGDARFFSNPQMAAPGQVQSTSIGSGLGADPNLFVQHAVRATQTRADFLSGLVEGRLGRVSLSSDRSLPTPDLFEPNANQLTNQAQPEAQVQADAPAPEATADADAPESVDVSHADTEASPRVQAAQSFTEQLRGGRARLPAPLLAQHKSI